MDLRHLRVGRLVARVGFSLDAEAMKGRVGFRSGIRPNHWMPGREYTFFGQLDFEDRDWLRPGETCVATGHFIIAEQDADRFTPGFCWKVGESVRIVGECRLLSVEEPLELLPERDDWR